MIRRLVPLALSAALALAVAAACSPTGAVKQDAPSAAAAKAQEDSDQVAKLDRRKADMEQAGARARGAAASDITRSAEREARIAAEE